MADRQWNRNKSDWTRSVPDRLDFDHHREERHRLIAHGLIEATDIECGVQNGEVTLSGLVDNREAKRAAEDVAEGVQGVVEDAERITRALADEMTWSPPKSR